MEAAFLRQRIFLEIKTPKKYADKELFIGSVTDPYNPQEEIYGRTRALLTQLQGSGAKISIATKSDLILRDLELIKSFPNARVSWPINTLDKAFREDMDKAVSIQRRLAAMEAFHKAGVRTTCFISPIFPGITKECLLDQSVMAGIGNIYSDEILFAAKIYPARPANSLTKTEWKRLTDAVPERLAYFIEKNALTQTEYLESVVIFFEIAAFFFCGSLAKSLFLRSKG